MQLPFLQGDTMNRSLRCLLVLAVFGLLCTVAQATSSLSFFGGGYTLYFEIGHDQRPVIASITVHQPGADGDVVLRGNYVVETFDTTARQMRLVYAGADPRVAAFTLVVDGETATLHVAGRRIDTAFDWFM